MQSFLNQSTSLQATGALIFVFDQKPWANLLRWITNTRGGLQITDFLFFLVFQLHLSHFTPSSVSSLKFSTRSLCRWNTCGEMLEMGMLMFKNRSKRYQAWFRQHRSQVQSSPPKMSITWLLSDFLISSQKLPQFATIDLFLSICKLGFPPLDCWFSLLRIQRRPVRNQWASCCWNPAANSSLLPKYLLNSEQSFVSWVFCSWEQRQVIGWLQLDCEWRTRTSKMACSTEVMQQVLPRLVRPMNCGF